MLKRLMEIKKRKEELRSKINKLSGDELDEAIKEVDKLDEEEKELEKTQAEQDEEETKKAEKRGRTLIFTGNKQNIETRDYENPEKVAGSAEYRCAFLKKLQGKPLTDIEKRAMTTADNSVGAVIPTLTMNKIIEKLEQYGVVLPLVTTLNIPSNVKIPVEDTTNDFSWVSEGSASTDSNDKIGSISLGAYELIKTIEITAHVEAMSIDAFEGFIVAQLANKAKKAIDYAIINGAGSDSNTATGILTTVTAIDSETTTWTYNDLMEILKNLKSGYKQGAVFMMSTKTLYGGIAKIKDNNKQPIFKMETDGRFEGKLSGYPVVVYDNVADDTIIFGNFSYYFFNFVKNFEIAKDTSVGFKSAKTCYRALALCDGKPGLSEAFVVMELQSSSSSSDLDPEPTGTSGT